MSNNLSIEEQKLLTEFLGECWHEFESTSSTLCIKCNKHFLSQTHHVPRLDCPDWRVVGRLVEKVQGIQVEQQRNKLWYAYVNFDINAKKCSTPQLAICRAIVAYLRERVKLQSNSPSTSSLTEKFLGKCWLLVAIFGKGAIK